MQEVNRIESRCNHIRSSTKIYCVQQDCQQRYAQICEECLQQSEAHQGHSHMYSHQFQLKLHSEKEQLIRDLQKARNLNNLQEEVRDKFEEMRNQITSKLDACASQILEILNTEIQQTFNLKKIDQLLLQLADLKPQKNRIGQNLQRLNAQNAQNTQNGGEGEIVNEQLVQVMREIDVRQLDEIIYKHKEKYEQKYKDVANQIDDLQKKLDEFIRNNLNKIISNLRLNKLAFPLDEFSYSSKILLKHTHHVNKLVQLSPSYFASASSDYHIIIWSAITSKPLSVLTTDHQITSLEKFNSNTLLCGGPNGSLSIWNWKKKKCIRRIVEVHELSVDTIKKLDNYRVVTGGGDQFIKIWNIQNGLLLKSINVHTDIVNCIDIIEKQKIVCGSSDQNLTIWDINKGNLIKELAGHSGQIQVVKVISADIIASGATDQLLKIWKLREGLEYRSLSGHSSAIYSIEKLGFHEIASGSIDCTVKIWNWFRSQCLKTFIAHRQTVCSILRISNKQFVTASDDTTIKIWS